jgi:hypothetical protein
MERQILKSKMKRSDKIIFEHKERKTENRREAVVYWLRQTAHDQEVMGSNPGTV